MAITSIGYDGTTSEGAWSRMHEANLFGQAPHVVMSGCNVSPGVGTRALSVGTGVVAAPGFRADVTAAETVTLDANAGTTNRHDWVVMKIDWDNNATTIQVLKGVGLSPTLTQTSGTLWQVPLASVVVRPGVSVIAASDITARKPLRREELLRYRGQIAAREVFATSTGAVALSVALIDPGWSYRVAVSGVVRLVPSSGTTGYAALSARAAGVEFVAAATTAPFDVGNVGIPIDGMSEIRSGVATCELILTPLNVPAGGSFNVGSAYSHVRVRQVPA